jgi:hypothetical protein
MYYIMSSIYGLICTVIPFSLEGGGGYPYLPPPPPPPPSKGEGDGRHHSPREGEWPPPPS